MKILKRLIIILVLLSFAVISSFYLKTTYDNTVFAKEHFHEKLNYSAILESRKWHADTLGCTYAVVSLNKDSPQEPPKKWIDSTSWKRTPAPMSSTMNFVLSNCRHHFKPETVSRLEAALQGRDSYYFELTSEAVFVYSKTEAVAARLRYGD